VRLICVFVEIPMPIYAALRGFRLTSDTGDPPVKFSHDLHPNGGKPRWISKSIIASPTRFQIALRRS